MTYIVRKPRSLLQRVRGAIGRMVTGDQRQRLMTPDGPYAAAPYKGGDPSNRLTKGWQPDNYSGERAVGEGWDLLTRRIRDLQRNDPAIIALRRTLVDHIVGTGIGTVADVTIGEQLDDEFNNAVDEEFDWWAEHEADVRSKLSWYDMQRQVFGEQLDAGESLLLECFDPDPNRQVPLCYQVIEAEQIDETKDWPARGKKPEVRRGVEVDGFGRPTAFYLFNVHPGDEHAMGYDSVRVDASALIHGTMPGRPSQTRGISLYASITQSVRDVDMYLGSELTAANIGALFALIHKTKQSGAGFGFVGDGTDDTPTADEYGNVTAKLPVGIVSQVPIEDEIEQIAPQRPNSNAAPFLDLMQLQMCMAGNVSRYRMTRDYRATTYVSARAAHLDDKKAFVPLQRYFGRTLCLPVRYAWLEQLIGRQRIGGISPAQFRKQRRRWLRTELQTDGWEQIDPEKETKADILAIAAGLTTYKEVHARRGKNLRRVFMQIEREQKEIKTRGLELTLNTKGASDSNEPKEADYEAADAK